MSTLCYKYDKIYSSNTIWRWLNENIEKELKYLKVLSKQYPSISKASTEIINLEAILNLPKGTEHFISDIHGEYEQFVHILKNGSGVIKRKIEELFSNSIRDSEKKDTSNFSILS